MYEKEKGYNFTNKITLGKYVKFLALYCNPICLYSLQKLMCDPIMIHNVSIVQYTTWECGFFLFV